MEFHSVGRITSRLNSTRMNWSKPSSGTMGTNMSAAVAVADHTCAMNYSASIAPADIGQTTLRNATLVESTNWDEKCRERNSTPGVNLSPDRVSHHNRRSELMLKKYTSTAIAASKLVSG